MLVRALPILLSWRNSTEISPTEFHLFSFITVTESRISHPNMEKPEITCFFLILVWGPSRQWDHPCPVNALHKVHIFKFAGRPKQGKLVLWSLNSFHLLGFRLSLGLNTNESHQYLTVPTVSFFFHSKETNTSHAPAFIWCVATSRKNSFALYYSP